MIQYALIIMESPTELFAFELIDASRRRSSVPPDVSVDGDPLLFDGGMPIAFGDARYHNDEVLTPLSLVAGMEQGFSPRLLRPHLVARAMTRYLNPRSIINQALPDEEREKMKEVSRIPGFRPGFRRLLSWLEQPELQILYSELEGQYLVEDGEIAQQIGFFLGKLSRSEMEVIVSGEVDGEFFDLETTMKALFKRQNGDPDTLWQKFQGFGRKRRAGLVAQGLQHAPQEQRAVVTDNITSALLTDPFMYWMSTDGNAEMCDTARTLRGSELAKRLERADDTDIVLQQRREDHRRGVRLDHVYDVSVRERIERKGLLPTLGIEQDTPLGTEQSHVLGGVMLALLFMQEGVAMSEDEVAQIAKTHHYDPTERLARRLALSVSYTAYNSKRHIDTLRQRFELISGA